MTEREGKAALAVKSEKTHWGEWIALLCIFALGAIVHFHLNDFIKALESYPDELLYYDIARSLFQGNGITVRNATTGFQKILYAVVITPTFAISNGYLRVKVINALNSLLMASCVFPAWLTGRELKLRRGDRLVMALIITVWPETLYSMTFMSENIFWPVFLWYVYVWTVNARRRRLALSLLEGVLCYVGYLAKEVFLVVFLATIGVEIVFPIVDHWFAGGAARRGKPKRVWRVILNAAAFAVAFVGCYALAKAALFSRFSNTYGLGGESFFSVYNFVYLIYGFLYLLAAAILSCFILPVMFPAAHYRWLDRDNRRFYVFGSLLLLLSVAVVAYTVTVYEDLGRALPSIHIRYLGPVLVLFFFPFLKSLGLREVEDRRGLNLRAVLMTVAASVFVVFTFKGTTVRSAVEQYTLQWYLALQRKLTGLITVPEGKMVIALDVILIDGMILLAVAVLLVLFARNRRGWMKWLFLAGMAAVCAVNYQVARDSIAPAYAMPTSMIEPVERLDAFMREQGPDETKLYVTNATGVSPYMQCFETYFDDMDGFYMANGDQLRSLTQQGEARVSEAQLIEPLWRLPYDAPERIDYVIVGDDVDLGIYHIDNLEELPELASGFYRVYRNLKPEALSMSTVQRADGDSLLIMLCDPGYNADLYVPEGLSWRENGFSWTDGDRMRVVVPMDQAADRWDVVVHAVGTFNGEKSYFVYDQDDKVVASGAFEGEGAIRFTAPASEEALSFDLVFPDAQVVSDVYADSTDGRKVAFMLDWITVDRHAGD